MALLISIIAILACILLVIVVFIQNPKGGGLTGDFGTQQLGGVQRANDFIEKATWGLSIAIVVCSLALTSILKPAQIVQPKDEGNQTEQPGGKQGNQQQGGGQNQQGGATQ